MLLAVSDVIWQAIIAGVVTIILALLQGRTHRAIQEVHRATNGMKAELVEEVRNASFARGVKSEADKHHT